MICVEDTIAAVPVSHKDDAPTRDEETAVTHKGHKHKKKRKHHHIDDDEPSYTYPAHKKHASKLPPTSSTPTRAVSWLAPNLRVSIISKDYRKGLYYNHKVSISYSEESL